MMIRVAPDVWVNPEHIECVEYDVFQLGNEGKRVMIRFRSGGSKLVPSGHTVADVINALSG